MRWLSLWGPVAALMALLFLVSSSAASEAAELVWDKLAHAVAYGTLGVLNLRAIHGGLVPLRPRRILVALAITLLYGALDEWRQAYVPGRDPSLLDWVADLCGAAAAVPLTAGLVRLRAGRG